MICEYYGKKCLYTPVALSLSCENCVVKMAYKNGVIKGREDLMNNISRKEAKNVPG